ncbi:MAG TPA: hypothetical protein VLW25_07045 [Bryobacteraceae bacterium]|nr:hypothetical protein [Bryobacteraceae bacterium]
MKTSAKWLLTSVMAVSLAGLPGFAQDPSSAGPPPAGGWKRFPQNASPAPPADTGGAFDPSQQPQQPPPPAPPAPSAITIPAGTWLTIRVNEPLSSDHNQAGDAFAGTLAAPLVVNGLVVAHRGETVIGRVTEAKKAGHVSGLSRLGLEVTEITMADGNQVQVKTSVTDRRGNTSYGRDAFGIGASTATGAAIGAGVNGGVGAGVGAAAGVVAGTIGVLLTRGRATVVYPEMPLTFRTENPVTIQANYDAFRPASQQDYGPSMQQRPSPRPGYGAPGYGAPYGPPPAYGYYPAYPYPYPYAYYPYPYWGPSLYFGFGRGWGRRW